MSEYNIAVDSGASVRLKTAGKYCDRDIVVTAAEGGGGGGSDIDALIDGTLTEIINDSVTFMRDYALYRSGITRASFSRAERIGYSAFNSCTNLVSVEFQSATIVDQYAFSGCSMLTKAEFSRDVDLDIGVFNKCSSLKSLVLRAVVEVVDSISNTTLNGTAIASGTGYIYVPAASVDVYKNVGGWKAYAAQFRALEDYTVDGTITGELDESKI